MLYLSAKPELSAFILFEPFIMLLEFGEVPEMPGGLQQSLRTGR